jgi:hypothetical protein
MKMDQTETNQTHNKDSEDGIELRSFGIQQLDSRNNLTITEAATYAGVRPVEPEEIETEVEISYARAVIDADPNSIADMVPAVIIDDPNADGRKSQRVRAIQMAGGDPPHHTFRVRLSERLLKPLGINIEDTNNDRIELLAGERMIAFRKPQAERYQLGISQHQDPQADPLDMLGPVASKVFREVEIKRRHPRIVALEQSTSIQSIIRHVRDARERLRVLVDQGYQVDYDFDDPYVPDGETLEQFPPKSITPELPTDDMSDGELPATVHSILSTYLTNHPNSDLATEIFDVVGTDADAFRDDPTMAAEAFVEDADREELVDIYLLIEEASSSDQDTATTAQPTLNTGDGDVDE